jgi:hypothetical protein
MKRAGPACSIRQAILRACLCAPVIAMFTKRLSTSDERARPASAEDGEREIGQGRRHGDEHKPRFPRSAQSATNSCGSGARPGR